ncbi:MAG: FKBP-type peptidyl-prolyl cis-trans isomerase [Bacteroidetes bacterium]|nr:FKBP-type peptidyl-prolyl cis-trans isomerase [Bacteroidota bacterium]
MKGPCLLFMAAVALLAGCGRSPLRGGSEIADGIFWRLNQLGDGELLPTDSDSVLVRVRAARPGEAPGSLFSTEQWYAMAGSPATEQFFGRMRQGDSATVLLLGSEAPWAELGTVASVLGRDTGWVQLELSMREVRSLATSRRMAREALMARDEADEARILRDYFVRSAVRWDSTMGLWFALDSPAVAGPRVQSGDLVTLAYTASFLDNGQVFDRQSEQDGGITFRLGDPGQVIKGLEIAAHLLPRQGGHGRFILPAELAFGPKGSSSGIVPPWTPVEYDVRVVAAEQGAVAPL